MTRRDEEIDALETPGLLRRRNYAHRPDPHISLDPYGRGDGKAKEKTHGRNELNQCSRHRRRGDRGL